MVQGELFREENYHHDPYESGSRRSFLARHQLTITLDKFLLGWLGVLLIFILAYSFGVEHGKRAMEKRLESVVLAQSETVAPLPVSAADPHEVVGASKQETVLLINETKPKLPSSEKGVEGPPLTPDKGGQDGPLPLRDPTREGKYTIQLVTYMDATLAKKEIDRLKTGGHEGFVIPSGRYFQVCANYVDSVNKAQNLLREFVDTGRYPDAFVRPVVRQAP